MTYRMTDALTDALAEIERLQARVKELYPASARRLKLVLGMYDRAVDDIVQHQACASRREQLLRDALPFVEGARSTVERADVARAIRAELGPELSKAERDGIIAEYEAGDL